MNMATKNLIIIFCLLLFLYSAVAAKEYELAEIQIHAVISAAGTLSVEEFRTYIFSGPFSWADYRLPLEKLGPVQYFRCRQDCRCR